MRLAVLADIHGNLPALEAVLADVQRHGVDDIIVAGDHVTGGPHPVQVLCLLRSLGCWMILGNREDYLLTYDAEDEPDERRESDQWASLRWTYLRLGREMLDFIASLPQQRVVTLDGAAPIRVVHGSPRDLSEGLFPDHDLVAMALFERAGFFLLGREPVKLDVILTQMDEPVLVCGHTHIPWTREKNGRLVLNPGSVGTPLNGDVRAQYALLTWREGRWWAEQRAVPYDLDRVRAGFRASGLLEAGGVFARSSLLTIETGRNVQGYLVAHIYGMAAEAGFGGRVVVPDAIWERAVDTFDWDGAAL
jgi:predicted phosphodiesterase